MPHGTRLCEFCLYVVANVCMRLPLLAWMFQCWWRTGERLYSVGSQAHWRSFIFVRLAERESRHWIELVLNLRHLT